MMEKQAKVQQKQKKKWINPLRDRTRVIPFVVPDKEERMAALGSLAGEKWKLKKSLLAIIDEFQPIKTPEPGDNLYQFEQQSQGVGLFSSMNRNHIDIEKETIYICTFYSKLSEDTVKKIKKKAKAFFYGVKVKLFQFHKIDLNQFQPMEGPDGQKYYDAGKMNTYFAKQMPKNTYSIAILTNLLIYNGNNPKQLIEDKWVFGLGSIRDRSSVISFQQIVVKGFGGKRQENQQDESEDNVEFLIRVVNHQLCHTFGMRHCIYHRCSMNGSNHYKEAFEKSKHLCPICIRKLQLAVQFDIADRYEAIGDEKSLMLAEKIRSALKIHSK